MSAAFRFSSIIGQPAGLGTLPRHGYRSRRPLHGFTLVELLVVIAILSVLAALLLPALQEALHAAQQSHCLNNQRQLAVATFGYADEFGGWFPLTYERLSTAGGSGYPTRPTTAASQSAMGLLVNALGDVNALYCPTFWSYVDPDAVGADLGAGYVPGGALRWGYEKWAGSCRMKPVDTWGGGGVHYNNRYHSAARSGYCYPPPPDTAARPYTTGYLTWGDVDRARRTSRSLGNSGTPLWGTAAVHEGVGGGSESIPPSQIALYSCSNNVSGSRAVSSSHSRIAQEYNPPSFPPSVRGVSEVMADGHAAWYTDRSGLLHCVNDGQAGGGAVLVQCDQ